LIGGCTGPSWRERREHAVLGAVRSLNTSTEQACRDACIADVSCVGVDVQYTLSPMQCWVHVNRMDYRIISNIIALQGMNSYELIDRCSSPGCSFFFIGLCDRSSLSVCLLSGVDLSYHTGVSVSQVKPSNCFRLRSTSMISKHSTTAVPDSLYAPRKISFTFHFSTHSWGLDIRTELSHTETLVQKIERRRLQIMLSIWTIPDYQQKHWKP